MVSPNESNTESRNTETQSGTTPNEVHRRRSTDLEASDVRPEPFSDDDPFRTARTSEALREAAEILSPIQTSPVGFAQCTPEQQRRIYQDAEERASWSQARKDGFTALLRLGQPLPSRANRVL